MNTLIVKILPDIERAAKLVTRNRDQQNELRQYCVMECYKYEDKVKELYTSKLLRAWIHTVIKREFVRMKRNDVQENEIESEDIMYCDRIEEIKELLTHTERAWINAYIKDGSYKKIHERTGINEAYVSVRIKCIIEKCKRLKDTLL